MLVAHALRFLPEFVPGSDLKSRFRRVRIWMYAALHPRAARCWFNALVEHRVLADIARHDRRFAERPFHGLAQLHLGALERVAMIRDHHVLMERLLGDALTRRIYLMGEHVVLAACPPFSIVLKSVTRCRREGLLTVACTDAETGVDLAWATLTLEMRYDTRTPGLFIGGLQGPGGEHRERVRIATRASHGLRPKAAVMERSARCASCWISARSQRWRARRMYRVQAPTRSAPTTTRSGKSWAERERGTVSRCRWCRRIARSTRCRRTSERRSGAGRH